jgi:hypothetical protein
MHFWQQKTVFPVGSVPRSYKKAQSEDGIYRDMFSYGKQTHYTEPAESPTNPKKHVKD